MRKRVLCVGHDACRAGAQVVLLHLLRWLCQNGDAEYALVLGDDGELLDDYRAVLPTRVIPTKWGRANRPAAQPNRPDGVRYRLRRYRRGEFDVIYANTTTSLDLAIAIADRVGCTVVCHVHELEHSIRSASHATRLSATMAAVDHFIAVSAPVADNLVVNHGVDPDRITQIPECVPVEGSKTNPDVVVRLRSELGIPAEAFVVGGSGTAGWRKGTDVFLLVARAVADRSRDRPVHFLWVGGERPDLAQVQHDIERLRLGDVVHVVSHRADPAPYFELFDAFFLSSREDPFPLVCLEAAALAKPIVCFANAGGMPDFVDGDAGFVVSYLDVAGASGELLRLATDGPLVASLGRRAAAKVAERCSVDVVAPRIAAVMDGRCGV